MFFGGYIMLDHLAEIMKISITLLLFALLSIACKESNNEIPTTSNPVPNNPETGKGKRYLALGDSYTIGQSVSIPERWPVIMAKDLSNQNVKVLPPDIIAVTGWTTANLLAAIENDNPPKNYDLVSLLIGVNNQYQGQSIDTFRKEFKQLLQKSTELAYGDSKHVFVLSIPDWGVSRYGAGYDRKEIAKEIDQFNKVVEEECASAKILFINITEISRTALNNPSMIASDGLHFSGQMHQLWVDTALPQVKTRL